MIPLLNFFHFFLIFSRFPISPYNFFPVYEFLSKAQRQGSIFLLSLSSGKRIQEKREKRRKKEKEKGEKKGKEKRERKRGK